MIDSFLFFNGFFWCVFKFKVKVCNNLRNGGDFYLIIYFCGICKICKFIEYINLK